MEDEALLEPIDLYKNRIADEFLQNADAAYEDLVKEAGLNVPQNIETVKNYNAAVTDFKKKRSSLGKQKALKVFLILGIILFAIVAALFFALAIMVIAAVYTSAIPLWALFVIAFGVALFIPLFAVLLHNKVKPAIAKGQEETNAADALQQKLLAEAYEQMAPLNDRFDWNMAAGIIKKTTPIIQMDQYLDMAKFDFMRTKYGFKDNDDPDSSIVGVLSGSLVGNPFLEVRTYNTEMVDKIYTGELTIYWTETERDSEGHTVTVHRSETLHASVSHPAPIYYNDTYLIYGNEAAPDLTFSREPHHSEQMSQSSLQHYVVHEEKKARKLAEESTKKGGSFLELQNPEFETLFHAWDRNNEVQFRLLFTPLAQNNMVHLVTRTDGYGDDFHFIKRGMINTIHSEHSQSQDYSGDPSLFASYSYELSKKAFLAYNASFFKSIYFDLAPLLSIPLYQQMKPKEYIYKEAASLERYLPSYEEEALVNQMGQDPFKDARSITPAILKVKFLAKVGGLDSLKVLAHSYQGIERVDYVRVHGGDGFFHDVPVHWIEYQPLTKTTDFMATPLATSRYEWNARVHNPEISTYLSSFVDQKGLIYQQGRFGFFPKNQALQDVSDRLSSYFEARKKE